MEDGLFSFSNIHRCWLKCRRRKRGTINALRFELDLERNLLRLERELKTRSYQPARSVRFAVKRPKAREIFAADFRDRIVHHILVDRLEKIFEPKFIFDSYACRTGKGTHRAVKRLQTFARRVTANDTRGAFFLQMDVKSYFASIDKGILLDLIRRRISDPDTLWLAETVINHDCARDYVLRGKPGLLALVPPHKMLVNSPKNCGLPIGNLTSQFFANVYLNELDQYVKRELKAGYYIRYVDDFLLLSTDREQLVLWREKITEFIRERLNLEIHPQKRRIAPVSDGMDFAGYIVRPGYILARRRVVRNFRNKLREIERVAVKGDILEFQPELVKKACAVTNSYLAHFNHADTYRLKTALAEKYPFIGEFSRVLRLVEPHYFPCLAAQYGFFKKALSGVEYYWDETGQLCFRDLRALLFFHLGNACALYGRDAVEGTRVLGLKPDSGPWPGGLRAFFPAAFEKKYADAAVTAGYSVYIAGEQQDIRFNHGLLPRILLRAYPGRNRPEGAGRIN
ncbi:MAG: RNA-directed DNA polymerase [Elusimicrobia bacterium]|nr:RNA-directed DNA polymerase [Elusimicrobiota bacterium]